MMSTVTEKKPKKNDNEETVKIRTAIDGWSYNDYKKYN